MPGKSFGIQSKKAKDLQKNLEKILIRKNTKKLKSWWRGSSGLITPAKDPLES
jgi:hypothetical protein